MTEQIGLEAVFDTTKFNKGISDYEKGIAKVSGANQKAVAGAEQAQQSIAASIGKFAVGFGKFAAPAVFAGGVALAKESVDLYREQAKADAQLATAIKSTGGAAGLTVGQLKDMALQLQQITNYGDETTEGAQALLLTFTRVGGETFPRATKAILDTATAMKQDLGSATLTVGKALNDPIAGLSALTRNGIQFTEQQKQQITTLTQSGQLAQAQAVILSELERQFGGSAEAARLADGNFIAANNALGDLKETIGSQLIPAMGEFNVLTIEAAQGWQAAIVNIAAFTTAMKETNTVTDEQIGYLKAFVGGIAPVYGITQKAGDIQYYFGEALQGSLEWLIDNTDAGQAYAQSIADASVQTDIMAKASQNVVSPLSIEAEAAMRAAEAYNILTDAKGNAAQPFSENRRRQAESARYTGLAGASETIQYRTTGLNIAEIQAMQALPEQMKEISDAGTKAAQKISSEFDSALGNLKSTIESQIQPTLDEVWKPPEDAERIDEAARRLATVSTAGFGSEWLTQLNQQFAGQDFWQPVVQAMQAGDDTALREAANNILTNSVQSLWNVDLIKQRARQDLEQAALKQSIIDEIAAQMQAEGVKLPNFEGLATDLSDGIQTGVDDAKDEFKDVGASTIDGIL